MINVINLYKARAGAGHKIEIVSLVERESDQKRSFHVANVTSETVEAVLTSQAYAATHLMSEESGVYERMWQAFQRLQHE